MLIRNKLSVSKQDELIKKCSNCSMCREICPTYLASKRESRFAGGRMRIFRTFVEEGINSSKELNNLMAYCTTCGQCEELCPIQLDYVEIIEKLRQDLATNNNKVLLEGQKRFLTNLIEKKNPYGENQEKRMKWANEGLNLKSTGTHAYFVGCTASYRDMSSAINTAKILSKNLKEGFILLKENEYCCGSPFLRTGLVDLKYVHNNQTVKFSIKEYINHNIQILKKKGVKEIICNCAGCYKTISEDWPKFVDESFPFKVTHITEFLAEKLERNRIMLKSFPKTITYHDPCHLGRHMGIYEEPRIILNSIPDANIIEMKNNKENGLCCGAGGGFKAHFPDEALKIAKLRVREALDDGAEIISTACVFCKNNLNLAIKDIDKEIRVLNIEDILANLIK